MEQISQVNEYSMEAEIKASSSIMKNGIKEHRNEATALICMYCTATVPYSAYVEIMDVLPRNWMDDAFNIPV